MHLYNNNSLEEQAKVQRVALMIIVLLQQMKTDCSLWLALGSDLPSLSWDLE